MSQSAEEQVRILRGDERAHTQVSFQVLRGVYSGHVGVKLNLGRDLCLVNQQLYLCDVNCTLELYDKLLREEAEALSLPSIALISRIRADKLAHHVRRVLT